MSDTQARDIISTIDNGAAWVNFIGHGSPNTMDVDGWKVSNLNNPGRYFVLSTFSCQTGAFARLAAGASVESVVAHYFPGTEVR